MNEWREFHGTTRTGDTKVWMIRQDGDTYHVRHGKLGGKMQDTGGCPGPKGKVDASNYMDAVANCTFNMERLIRKKEEKGYVEQVDGQAKLSEHSAKTADTVDFSRPLPSNFCPHKPWSEKKLTAKKHEKIFKTGRARYTRKRDGECCLMVHHTGDLGWRIYTRTGGDDVTDKFPYHQVAMMTAWAVPTGTIIAGEMVVSRKDGTDDTIAFANLSRASAGKARGRVESGQVPEPVWHAFDVLFWGGQDLKDKTYDERQQLFDDVPLFNGENPFIHKITVLRGIGPKNWAAVIKREGWEGMVLVDGGSVAGEKLFTFNGNAARPGDCFKLKLNKTEDVVVYAALRGKGSNRETVGSLFVKQKSPRNGQWFDCGKVGSGLIDKEGELNRDDILELCRKSGVPFIDSEKDPFMQEYLGNKGFVIEVEYASRQPDTNKLKFPVIKRLRHDKGHDECFAQTFHG